MEDTLLKVLWADDGRQGWADDEVGHAVPLDRARSGASSVAGQGIHGVRCKWGRVQEPSFLLRLEEVRIPGD